MALFVPYFRVTHSGVYADGRANTSSVFLTDVNFGFDHQNRKQAAYIPAGGFIDLPYTSDSAFSFDQGDIKKFTTAGLVASELVGLAPPTATTQSFYQDDPGALGPGTYAESFPILLPPGVIGTLFYVGVRQDFPAAVGETATIRLFRYRKASGGAGLMLNQITSAFVLDSTDPWSFTIDITANILNFDLDFTTDSIAVSNVYTNTGASTMRALRVDFQIAVEEAGMGAKVFSPPTPSAMVWPPS